MPFPIPALALGIAAQPASTAFFFEACAALGVTKLGVDTYNHYFNSVEELPAFRETAAEVVQSARTDIDALVTAASEHLRQVEVDTLQQNTRMDESSANYEMQLITMERGTVKLDEAVTVLVESQKENSGEFQRAIEAQADTEASLKTQKTAVQSIAASLENLPELLQSNREKQALRVEHARLLLEKESYTARANMLLDVIKEKDEVNERLQAQVDTLEAKFSGLASQMEKVLAFAQSKQREVDEFRAQTNEQGAENQGTHFSLNLFS
ncbi:MAG: hypothetical protein P1U36_10115 [Legionellaceae bacterium]|nr:hypothetical protein [Legionellaceae bacterium]